MKTIKKILITIVILLIAVITLGFPYLTSTETVGTVTGKEVKRIDDFDTYLVYIKDENGTPVTFKIKDSLAYLQFRSSDLFGSLNDGDRVKIKSYGLRIPLFSKYKTIYDIQVLESLNEKTLKTMESLNNNTILYFEKDGKIYKYNINNKKLELYDTIDFNNIVIDNKNVLPVNTETNNNINNIETKKEVK